MQNVQTKRHEEQIALRLEFLEWKAFADRLGATLDRRDGLLANIATGLRAA